MIEELEGASCSPTSPLKLLMEITIGADTVDKVFLLIERSGAGEGS